MTPTVSVVLVSYETHELTRRGLDFPRTATTAVPIEMVVVDNASSDGSADADWRDVWRQRSVWPAPASNAATVRSA
jgi:hypothetical protein